MSQVNNLPENNHFYPDDEIAQYVNYPQPYQPMMPQYPQMEFPQYGMPMPMQPTVPDYQEGPPTITDKGYMPAYLRTQIGKKVKVTFVVGTNLLVDREGELIEVGINYIILREAETDDLVVCDLYSIKFVKIYY